MATFRNDRPQQHGGFVSSGGGRGVASFEHQVMKAIIDLCMYVIICNALSI